MQLQGKETASLSGQESARKFVGKTSEVGKIALQEYWLIGPITANTIADFVEGAIKKVRRNNGKDF